MVVGPGTGMVVGLGIGMNDTILLCSRSPPTYAGFRRFFDTYLFFLAWGGLRILVISMVLR